MLRSARKDTYQSKNYEQTPNCSIPNRRRSREQLLTPNSTFKIYFVPHRSIALRICRHSDGENNLEIVNITLERVHIQLNL